MEEETHRKVYIGKRECGCIMAGRLAEPFDSDLDRARCAESVGEMIEAGLVVSRVDGPVCMTGHVCKEHGTHE